MGLAVPGSHRGSKTKLKKEHKERQLSNRNHARVGKEVDTGDVEDVVSMMVRVKDVEAKY